MFIRAYLRASTDEQDASRARAELDRNRPQEAVKLARSALGFAPRDPESLASPDLAGLYPCGEGAGYAGGIVSAALDGMRVARAICATLGVASNE